MTDPIADLLTRIRNAQKAGNDSLFIPFSRTKLAIAKKMQEKGFLKNIVEKDDGKFKEIMIELDLERDHPVTLLRVSKPGQRIYKGAKDLKTVKSGLGIEILSTSKGIMNNYEAYNQKIGGEILCQIY